MEYLDEFDGQIPNFDNNDTFVVEARKVKQIQGPNFRFGYLEYSVKILLASFVRYYFNLDQRNAGNSNYYASNNNNNTNYNNRFDYNTNVASYVPSSYVPRSYVPPTTYDVYNSNQTPQACCTIM